MQTFISLLMVTVLLMSFVVLCDIIYKIVETKLSKKSTNQSPIATIHKYNEGKNFCPFSPGEEDYPCDRCRCSVEHKSADGKEHYGYVCGLVYKF